ncbi:MAG TPA: AGE family epimerase/isomerase [Arachnia sp.]|nr:AGE family epimerase/isomerase [Arachnia sp.]HMT86978.1 AGE family epimerase/isomerase [Arachnia sp.]
MTPGDPTYRAAQRADLLRFAAGSRHEAGFGYLDEDGRITPTRPVELWITCRMTHVFAMGLLAGEAPASGGPDSDALRALAQHGVDVLLDGPLRDTTNGGWFAGVNPDGSLLSTKMAYAHAFVILAATSAQAAGLDRADELLELALATQSERFWDEEAGLSVEEWDADWSTLSDYRGVNSNMHTVECYLAAGDVTGDPAWHRRAGRIGATVAGWARDNDWRIPEHFTSAWEPLLGYHHDQPAHPFQPYGATVGHGLEWARLLVQVDESLGDEAPEGLTEAAVQLTRQAIADGWHADGADGFVYTTDWEGRPVVRARMHWVLAEAINTSEVLRRVTGDETHAADVQRWWDYADRYLIDHVRGSWVHELGTTNEPQFYTWPGKPDVYHAYQAAWMQDLPTTPSYASALKTR